MQFDVYFTIQGPAGTAEMPNRNNPVEYDSLAGLLIDLASNLPYNSSLGIDTVGIRVELAKGPRNHDS